MFRAEADSAGTLSPGVLDPEQKFCLEVLHGSRLRCSWLSPSSPGSWEGWIFLQGFPSAAALFSFQAMKRRFQDTEKPPIQDITYRQKVCQAFQLD